MVGRGVGRSETYPVNSGIGIDEALDHHLAACRHFEVDGLALHHLDRLTAVGAEHGELRHAGRQRAAAEEAHDRIPADDAGHRHLLAAVGVLGEVLAPVLAALDQERRDRVLLADHAAIDAGVLHAGVRILGHDAGVGVDVAPAFEVVPLGHRELEQVDVLALDDVLLHGPGRHHHGLDLLAVLLHHVLDDLVVRRVLGEAQREVEARARADAAAEHLAAAGVLVAFHVFEQQRRALFFQHPARDRADLAVPVHLGGDPVQFAFLFQQRDPLAQVDAAHAASQD